MDDLVRSATTECRKYARNRIQETMQMYKRDETLDINVENPNVGKTTAAHRLQKIALYERNTTSRKHRGNDLLSSSLSPHAAVTTRRQRPLSLSHALYKNFSIIQQHFNNYKDMCPKSYLYIYDFSAYLHLGPSNRSVPIGAGSVMSRFSASSIRRYMFPNT